MEWNFQWIEPHRILRVATVGCFSLERQARMFGEILAVDGWQTGTPIIFDNRFLKMKDVNVEVIRESVQIVSEFNRCYSKAPIAGIVEHNINFGFGRQFETICEFADGTEFRLFDDEALAIDWLRDNKTAAAEEEVNSCST